MSDAALDLIDYINASPTPYHAVAETARRLEAGGYRALAEEDAWQIESGTRAYVTRADGSLIAFEQGTADPAVAGFHAVGAHTDSPNLRVKPLPNRTAAGVRQLTIEPYGGLLLHTWFDRDCSLAGRVTLRDESGALRTVFVDFERPLLRVPSLAIHLMPEIRESGFKPNAQDHMHPLWALQEGPDLAALLDEILAKQGAADERVVAHDLMLYDTQPAALSGADNGFVHAARLDNLASCHAALTALLAGDQGAAPFTRVMALWDHEEVGSRSAQGAMGPFLRDALTRLTDGVEGLRRAVAQSALISADMAHAVHPNYAGRHDAEHQPVLGGGPVIKWNVNQSYATDAHTGGLFASLCERVGVTPQHYSHRNDMRCGSTIGPITAGLLGMRSVDVGNPMLSMHSCREMCATSDVPAMIQVLRAWYETL